MRGEAREQDMEIVKKSLNKIVWLTGPSGAGKTTLARRFQENHDCIILDGDEMRDSISLGAGFSKEDRREHNLRVARLAKILAEQKMVIVSVIAPMKDVRKEIDQICSPTWIYLKRKLPKRRGHFYEEPDNYITINIDECNLEAALIAMEVFLHINPIKYSMFIGRWQAPEALHEGHLALFNKIRKEGGQILIAIRNTVKSETDPLTAKQRMELIQNKVPDAKVIIIPDIKEVVYGREVGYKVRQIKLDEKIENISGSKLRNETKKN